jgi:hypothetical protein
MRHLMLCGVLLAAAASASESEQPPEPEARRTFLGLEAMALGRGNLSIEGERAVSPKLSVRLGVRLGAGLFEERTAEQPLDTSSFSLGAAPGLRYYLTGTALDGLWVGSNLELLRVGYTTHFGEASQVTTRNRSWSVGMTALVGYSMVVSRGLTVQAGVGLGGSYTSSRLTSRNTTLPAEESDVTFRQEGWGISERATLVVGWAF